MLLRPCLDLRGTVPEDHGIMAEKLRKLLLDHWASPAQKTEAYSFVHRQNHHCQFDWLGLPWERRLARGQLRRCGCL